MPDPEALARIDIDRQLEAAGWIVQDRNKLNLFAGEGVAIREVSIPGAGEAAYLLVAGGSTLRWHSLDALYCESPGRTSRTGDLHDRPCRGQGVNMELNRRRELTMDSERRRKPTRLRGYDYRSPALYHVVNCTHQAVCRFGVVDDAVMKPNAIGDMIADVWQSIPETFPSISLDASVIMPNHHHGIIFIEPQPGDVPGASLGDVMKWFKTVTTVRYSHGARHLGWPPYDRRLWHRNYYDHIVRDDRDLERVRDYINSNPANWNNDRFYAMPG